MSILAACFATPFVFMVLAWTLPDNKLRKAIGPLSCLALLAFALAAKLDPAQRLLAMSAWMLFCLKGWSLLKRPRQNTQDPTGLLLFSYAWPGVDPRPFETREPDPAWKETRWFVLGFPTMAGGLAALLINANTTQNTFLALAAILTAVHLGFSDLLSSLHRLAGYKVPRLFDAPLKSRSLNEFWTRRWNGPFVEMNRILFRPLFPKKHAVLPLFLISGALHELAISFPAGGGWGGPMAYFALHGVLMRFNIKSRLWTWFWLLAPLPLLFHAPFRHTLIEPLLHLLRTSHPWETLLTLAGAAHFLVLTASFQVPHRLDWKNELQRLRPLNRKLMWVYGGYIFSMIALLGILTLNLKTEMIQGDKAALCIVALTALFWWSRILVDAFFFEHKDWPEGHAFVIGHTLLTSLFCTIASIYTALLLWHLVNRYS